MGMHGRRFVEAASLSWGFGSQAELPDTLAVGQDFDHGL